MRIEQSEWASASGWTFPAGERLGDKAAVVLTFGERRELEKGLWAADLRRRYPSATLVGCSSAGEILGERVREGTLVATAIGFSETLVRSTRVNVLDAGDSRLAGMRLALGLPHAGLRHVLVLSDGQHVNGTALVEGLTQRLPRGVAVTGGLAGDGDRFQRTYVSLNGSAEEGNVVALGLYGDRLRVGYGSLGGWDAWSREHVVTHAVGNVLDGLDGKPALDVYKSYLGDHAEGLPASGLLYPLNVTTRDGEENVRTLLGVDASKGSITFAGDVPVGSRVRIMRANFDRLVQGASGAAEMTRTLVGDATPQLALLVSCVGRRLVLKERVDEELAAVRRVLGPAPAMTGFYSYGEVCPSAPGASCRLHNQTMTITTLAEA